MSEWPVDERSRPPTFTEMKRSSRYWLRLPTRASFSSSVISGTPLETKSESASSRVAFGCAVAQASAWIPLAEKVCRSLMPDPCVSGTGRVVVSG